jgi:hypothetical protein
MFCIINLVFLLKYRLVRHGLFHYTFYTCVMFFFSDYMFRLEPSHDHIDREVISLIMWKIKVTSLEL